MKLDTILEQKKQYKIYCDLDGVLVNLVKRAKDLFGFEPKGHLEKRDKAKEAIFWSKVALLYTTGKEFWRPMEPMPDAMELWNFIEPLDPSILTSRGKIPQAEAEKRDWVDGHLSDTVEVFVVASGSKKAEWATPTAILIDDTAHVIEKWKKAGGIGILHTSAKDTIEKLKKILDLGD